MKAVAGATLMPPLLTGCDGAGSGEHYWLVAAQGDGEDAGLVAVESSGGVAGKVAVGFRGHDVAQHPLVAGLVVLFGRRPGTQSVVVDVRAQRVVQSFRAAPGRAFQGHGFFTMDGDWLVTSEADTHTGAGRLSIRRTDTYAVVDEVDTFGIGPHEVKLLAPGNTVVVANGGLLTRPETGREILNLDTMDSTLTYVDLSSGALVEQWRVGDAKSSIRHFDVDDDVVVIGMQVQRAALPHQDVVPLAGVHRRGQPIAVIDAKFEVTAALNDYVGSVATSPATRISGFSSPRGNVCAFWRTDDGTFVGHHEFADCSGLAVTPDGRHFILSSSTGEVRTLDASDLSEVIEERRRFEAVRWDNHLRLAGVKEES